MHFAYRSALSPKPTTSPSSQTAVNDGNDHESMIFRSECDGVIQISQDGEVISFDKESEVMLGIRSEEVIGKCLSDIIALPARGECNTGARMNLPSNRWLQCHANRANGEIVSVELAMALPRAESSSVLTVFIRNVAGTKHCTDESADSTIPYRQLVELSPEAILVYQHGKFTLLNQAACRLLGATCASDLLGREIFDFVNEDDHTALHASTHEDNPMPSPFIEQMWRRDDGTLFHAEMAAMPLLYNDAPAVQVVVRDITERKRLESIQQGQNRILNLVATGSPLAEILTEIASFVEAHSPQCVCSIRLLDGSSFSQIAGTSADLPDISASPTQIQLRASNIVSDSPWSAQPIIGNAAQVLGTFACRFNESRNPSTEELNLYSICIRLAAIAIESRTLQERMRFLAHHDGLTRLPNRFLFKEYLELALCNAQRHSSPFAVFFLDLDKFKEINDTLGHEAGDQVLREIAGRLRGCLRHTDKIARMGGDEFYILIDNLTDATYARGVAQKLLDEVSRTIHVNRQECRLSASIGIAIYPGDGMDSQTLLRNADSAMYRAKELGKDRFRFYLTINDEEIAA
ncbi:sensor domain-containing diguanylate cyclase [Noviherbaspirillum cavernae]|uniref:Sensor domain-containing diguanylate cyclase n=1 Tax=Noviherbaspirillum cavernae TaxID=2320862 RepID=A0A418X1R3_9BURK|nr:diguanylate cyclase [Noviherbaspirillum cavernae]RJG06375.1 sensor domain-containing diguanylate cyclase [Noviherbaspirillum cavernae]